MRKLCSLLLALLFILAASTFAQQNNQPPLTPQATYTSLVNDANGWKLMKNNQPFFVKGVLWGPTPINETYSFDLWSQPESYIKEMLDQHFSLLKAMGCNAIRTGGDWPAKWVTYVYENYGIALMMGNDLGRYGVTVDGIYHPISDYSDPKVREVIKENFLNIVQKYKDVPGVALYCMGNENNYGFSWMNAAIADIPVDAQWAYKARYFYSLVSEIVEEAKKIDPNHLYVLANGDIQYIDLIQELCPNIDIMGANVYRGPGSFGLYEEVAQKLHKPFIYTEFGSDAFNALTGSEDQSGQLNIIYNQWKDLFNYVYNKGKTGNAIGGFVFEFCDEWWKHGQVDNLDVHDTTASWNNAGYQFDWKYGVNNMNEEWFGICAQSPRQINGINQISPRAAYYFLQSIWKYDPYTISAADMNNLFSNMDLNQVLRNGQVSRLMEANAISEQNYVRLIGGSIEERMFANVQDYSKKLSVQRADVLNLTVGFQPLATIEGSVTVNVLGSTYNSLLEALYLERGLSYNVASYNEDTLAYEGLETIDDAKRVEIYQFQAKMQTRFADVNAFYHVGHYHWRYEGDMWNILPESFNLADPDEYDAKPPIGIEFTGKKAIDGLKLMIGPELYWGAPPALLAKYRRTLGSMLTATVLHFQPLGERGDVTGVTGTQAEEAGRRTEITLESTAIPFINNLSISGLWSGMERLGDEFTRYEKASTAGGGWLGSDYNVIDDSILLIDTLGVRAQVQTTIGPVGCNIVYTLTGLVADAGNLLCEGSGAISQPTGGGNVNEIWGEFNIGVGPVVLTPRGVYRKPLVGPNDVTVDDYYDSSANILYKGLLTRNRGTDPFAVTWNREAYIAELTVTYDPSGITWIHSWNNLAQEKSKVACFLTGQYAIYPTETDGFSYINENGDAAYFGEGLPAANTYTVNGRVIMNPSAALKMIFNLYIGSEQSTGGTDERITNGSTIPYQQVNFQLYYGGLNAFLEVAHDKWGLEESWYRQFNLTYPWQVKVNLAYDFGKVNILNAGLNTEVGLQFLHKILDEYSPNYGEVAGDYVSEFTFYTRIAF